MIVSRTYTIFVLYVIRERLAEVQREYEERERRWNRISALLNREDFLSGSPPSTSSVGTNQFGAASTVASLNNGSSGNYRLYYFSEIRCMRMVIS